MTVVFGWFVRQLYRFGHAALKNITQPDTPYDWPVCEFCGEEADTKVGRGGDDRHVVCFECAMSYLGAA